MENNLKLTMTISEVCAAVGVARPTVDGWIKRKDNPLPCIRTNKTFRIPRAALEQWLLEEAQRNSGGSVARR